MICTGKTTENLSYSLARKEKHGSGIRKEENLTEVYYITKKFARYAHHFVYKSTVIILDECT